MESWNIYLAPVSLLATTNRHSLHENGCCGSENACACFVALSLASSVRGPFQSFLVFLCIAFFFLGKKTSSKEKLWKVFKGGAKKEGNKRRLDGGQLYIKKGNLAVLSCCFKKGIEYFTADLVPGQTTMQAAVSQQKKSDFPSCHQCNSSYHRKGAIALDGLQFS